MGLTLQVSQHFVLLVGRLDSVLDASEESAFIGSPLAASLRSVTLSSKQVVSSASFSSLSSTSGPSLLSWSISALFSFDCRVISKSFRIVSDRSCVLCSVDLRGFLRSSFCTSFCRKFETHSAVWSRRD